MSIQPIDPEKLQNDKEEKKTIVLETIKTYCVESSPIQEFREIHRAFQQGDKLLAQIIPDAFANYTYKVYLASSPTTALFAKLSFPYAVSFPEQHFDNERTVNEFQIMKIFEKIAPCCVAVPYLCVGIDDSKLLVTQWCSAEESLADQMIHGCVDFRVATKLAHAIASLHCIDDFDPNFNTPAREFMRILSMQVVNKLHTLKSSDTNDRTISLLKDFSKEKYDAMGQNFVNDIEHKDCLLHSDLHAFNILVGKDGSTIICDWEMSFAGPIGRDLGFFHPFPLACALAHAINGNKNIAMEILDYLNVLWDEYSHVMMTKGGKDNMFMSKSFRNCLGYCGAILVEYYKAEFHIHLLPVEKYSVKYIIIKDAMGVLGLRFLCWGFGRHECDLTLRDLRFKFKEAVMNELENAFAFSESKS